MIEFVFFTIAESLFIKNPWQPNLTLYWLPPAVWWWGGGADVDVFRATLHELPPAARLHPGRGGHSRHNQGRAHFYTAANINMLNDLLHQINHLFFKNAEHLLYLL